MTKYRIVAAAILLVIVVVAIAINFGGSQTEESAPSQTQPQQVVQ